MAAVWDRLLHKLYPTYLQHVIQLSMPVLSPLIGLDKIEISEIAEKIGTFPISILPDKWMFSST